MTSETLAARLRSMARQCGYWAMARYARNRGYRIEFVILAIKGRILEPTMFDVILNQNARTFHALFEEVPIGRSQLHRWARENPALLETAAKKISAAGANPWVFVAGYPHFEQFAGFRERAALESLTPAETAAMLGYPD